jgi:hypothetical protein
MISNTPIAIHNKQSSNKVFILLTQKEVMVYCLVKHKYVCIYSCVIFLQLAMNIRELSFDVASNNQ